MSGANAPTDILASEMKRDPAFALAVGSLERCLRVRERVGSSLIVGRPDKPPGSGGFDAAVCEKESKGLVSDSQGIGNDPFSCAVPPVEVVRRSGTVGAVRDRSETDFKDKLSCGASGAGVALCAATVTASSASVACKDPRVSSGGAETAHVTAVEIKSINGLLEGPESDFSKNLAESTAADESAGSLGRVKSSAAHSTACESTRILGSFQLPESEFPSLNSSRLGTLSSACARRFACSATASAVRVCPGSSSLAVSTAVARAHASTLHDACSNSWSDTVRLQGPTRRRGTKGGVSSPAEDLRPISEVEAGVNFRPAGGVREQVAEASRHRYQAGQGKCGHTFLPPGGSWYPIRVTWIRIGHQAIDGLDESVWNHTVGNLGAKGQRQDLHVPCQS